MARRTERGTDLQICEGCHKIGHHYMECLNHYYVWDTDTNAPLLEPGERLSGPTNWRDIHRASLHHLLPTAIQYYIQVHHTRIQDIHILLTDLETNRQFGDISCFAHYGISGEPNSPEAVRDFEARPSGSSPLPTSFPIDGQPGIFLINLAVLAAATRLRIDPWNRTTGYVQFIALHHWHPSFGILFADFHQLVQTELVEGTLFQADVTHVNPFNLQVAPPEDQPNSPFEEPT
jgi:hypothetical protein